MSKKKVRRPPTPAPKSRRKRQVMISIGLALSVGLAGGLLAQWRAVRVATNSNPILTPAPVPPPSDLSANNPSKEYVHAGGKLVATEEPYPPDTAQFMSQTGVSAVMIMSRPNRIQTYPVSITMKNLGSNTWRSDITNPYKLKAMITAWSPQTVNLPTTSVTTNNQVTFSFTLTTPQTPGRYNFQWQMMREGLNSFNTPSQTASVLVRAENPYDFDNDGKADIIVWRGSESNWYVLRSSDNTAVVQYLGQASDNIVPGDYDGDLKMDIAVWRANNGNCAVAGCGWHIKQSSDPNNLVTYHADWGMSGDLAVPADYDGDGKTDMAVWRPSNGNWYIINSLDGTTRTQGWGNDGDKPVPGDYDGDGRADLAVFRPSEGNWYVIKSSGGNLTQNWGQQGDLIVPADYDGDGKTDYAVWRPGEGTWYIRNSADNTSRNQGWGNSTDKLVPADYDGDGKVDLAIWRPSEGNWYVLKSSDNSVLLKNWGAPNDVPVSTIYVR